MYEWNKYDEVPFEQLKGKTISEMTGCWVGSEEIEFYTKDGQHFRLTYHQECCASCSVEEIVGDVRDLIGSPILLAEDVSSKEPDEATLAERRSEYEKYGKNYHYTTFDHFLSSQYESETWCFYKLSTIKGSVTIRWYGSSNGCYSESATFEVEKATLDSL